MNFNSEQNKTNNMEQTKVIVLGAGFGGLCTALRLASKGFDVELVEQNANAGGRLNIIEEDGFRFDTGPTFFSMSYEFEEMAKDCNIKLPFEYERVDPLYAVNFANGNNYLLTSDVKNLAKQFEHLEPEFEQKFKKYIDRGKYIFDSTIQPIVKTNHSSMIDYIKSMAQTPPELGLMLFRNFWQEVCRYFTNEEVRQIMSLVAFFLGDTPFKTSSIYTLLSYTEFCHDGYYNVKGGLYKIVEGLVEVLKEQGVTFTFNTRIVGLEQENERVVALVADDGTRYKADVFVVNADAALFRGQVLKRKAFDEKHLSKMRWTFAPLTIYLGVNKKIDTIYHHNYYLGNNFREYAEKIFTNEVSMERPYYYVNVPSRMNPTCAPEGKEALFFVCPMPDLRYKKDWSDVDQIVNGIIEDFEQKSKISIQEHICYKKVLTPVDWEKKFNLYKGSGLGLAHNLGQVGFFRPKNYDEELKNLFYVGASTVPGTGLPMCVIGSKLVTERILKTYGNI